MRVAPCSLVGCGSGLWRSRRVATDADHLSNMCSTEMVIMQETAWLQVRRVVQPSLIHNKTERASPNQATSCKNASKRFDVLLVECMLTEQCTEISKVSGRLCYARYTYALMGAKDRDSALAWVRLLGSVPVD